MCLIKKLLNLFIWMFNVMNYFGHLELHRNLNSNDGSSEYEPYDFDKDVKYF